MRKTLQDLAGYLKKIIVPETQEAYTMHRVFENVSTEENIREGVNEFRAFLLQIYDVLITKGDAYDNYKKVAHEYENRTTVSVYYPFLHNVKTLLMNIGFRGVVTDHAQSLTCGNNIFNEKVSVSKTMECLRFLTDCGIRIDGIDLNEKKQKLIDIKKIKISYPSNPAMLTGLKVMAIAEIEFGTLVNQDVFLRCDYRVLKNDETDVVSILKDTIKPLSANVQNFVLELHQRYIDKGLKCIVEIKGFWIYIKYTYKRKDLWGVNASLNNGYQINVKTVNMHKYAETVETFPLFLQETIAKGYGCGRKRNEDARCDGGCRGMLIALDDSVLEISDDIVTWFDKELTFR